jgi:hypothetical protein
MTSRYLRNDRGVVIVYRVLFVLMLALSAGCANNEPRRASAGGQYVEEIKSPAPRGDTLMFDPNCLVR